MLPSQIEAPDTSSTHLQMTYVGQSPYAGLSSFTVTQSSYHVSLIVLRCADNFETLYWVPDMTSWSASDAAGLACSSGSILRTVFCLSAIPAIRVADFRYVLKNAYTWDLALTKDVPDSVQLQPPEVVDVHYLVTASPSLSALSADVHATFRVSGSLLTANTTISVARAFLYLPGEELAPRYVVIPPFVMPSSGETITLGVDWRHVRLPLEASVDPVAYFAGAGAVVSISPMHACHIDMVRLGSGLTAAGYSASELFLGRDCSDDMRVTEPWYVYPQPTSCGIAYRVGAESYDSQTDEPSVDLYVQGLDCQTLNPLTGSDSSVFSFVGMAVPPESSRFQWKVVYPAKFSDYCHKAVGYVSSGAPTADPNQPGRYIGESEDVQVNVAVTLDPVGDGCVLTSGYWKDHGCLLVDSQKDVVASMLIGDGYPMKLVLGSKLGTRGIVPVQAVSLCPNDDCRYLEASDACGVKVLLQMRWSTCGNNDLATLVKELAAAELNIYNIWRSLRISPPLPDSVLLARLEAHEIIAHSTCNTWKDDSQTYLTLPERPEVTFQMGIAANVATRVLADWNSGRFGKEHQPPCYEFDVQK